MASAAPVYDLNLLKELLKDECKMALGYPELEELVSHAEIITLKRGDAVCKYGMTDRNMYILLEGILARFLFQGEREIVDAFAQPGTFVCSWHSFYRDQPSNTNIEACCDCKLLKIHRSSFDKMLNTSPGFCRWFCDMLMSTNYYFEMKNREIGGSIQERYIALATKRPAIIQHVPLKTIAAYLGVTPRYLSALRARLIKPD